MNTTTNVSDKSVSQTQTGNGQTYRMPFAIMTTLFFMWGFMTVWNDILIPRFKDAFDLSYFQAMLIQFAFFGAYTVGSIIYYVISMISGDPINRIGYKNGVILGLLIAATGSLLFYPAAVLTGSSAFSAGSFKNMPSFVTKLKQPSDAMSIYLSSKLPEATRQALASYQGGGAKVDQLGTLLVQDLNVVLKGESVYNADRFAGIELRPETKKLLEQNPQGESLVRLNRLLLESAYPLEISRNLTAYIFFLCALFIVGLGFAMLQIAANPYVTILGPERTASSRLNLSQAFNSFGTTIGPIIGGYLIFKVFTREGMHGADSVKIPYLCFAAVFILLAIFFKFAHLPNFTNTEHISRGAGALKYPHTVLGMLAIFMYVGGEVSVGRLIVNYLGSAKLGGLNAEAASPFLAYYWGGLMIGRFMGAFALSDMRKSVKHLLVILTPIVAVGVILVIGWQSGSALCSVDNAKHYGMLLVVLLIAFFVGESSPSRMLALFSLIIMGLLATGIFTAGDTAKWAILGIGLFCSVMWSNIFSLAIEGLGEFKSQASSLLVMAILGAALLPPLQGLVADKIGIQASFLVPMCAFAYLVFYGVYGYRAGRKLNAPAQG